MNNKIYLKLFLFFLWIEVFILWISFKNISLMIVWLLNTIVILFMFFGLKIDLVVNLFKWLRNWFTNILFSWKKIYSFDNVKFDFSIILKSLKLFYLKWGFVLSVLILVLVVLDKILFHKFGLNLIWSTIFFFVWLVILYENILNWEIYIWNRLVNQKDVVFMLSLVLFFVVFILLEKFKLSERLFFSLLVWFVFYVVVIYMLDYVKFNMKFFKSTVIIWYIGLLLISFVVFIFYKVPEIKKYFTIEKVIYKEKPVYIKKIVYKEKPISEEIQKQKTNLNINSKTYIAPNWKIYDIILTSTWAYFTWYNDKRKYFVSYQEAKKLIDKFNQKIEISIKKTNSKNNFIKNDITDSNEEMIITEVMSSLLNWNEEKIVKNEEKSSKNINVDLTYYEIIPFIVNKYWLNNKTKLDINFKYILNDDKNYKYFKIAYYHKMFGKNSNPNLKVRCRNFAVLLWLAEHWDVVYNRNNVFDVFWNKALEKWYNFNNCCKSQYEYLSEAKKTCILK